MKIGKHTLKPGDRLRVVDDGGIGNSCGLYRGDIVEFYKTYDMKDSRCIHIRKGGESVRYGWFIGRFELADPERGPW